MIFFCIPGPDDQNRWNRKNCPKFFHRVIFAFWIQICNPNLCKSHIFWITANIEKWSFFAYLDLMTKIDEIGKITQNSLPEGNFAFLHTHIFWITANIEKCIPGPDAQNRWKNCPKFFHRVKLKSATQIAPYILNYS